jgi:hypothetical protein
MHADQNIALGFRSAPGDCSIAGSATLLVSGSSLFAAAGQHAAPQLAKVQRGVLELAQMFSVPIINSRMLIPQQGARMFDPATRGFAGIEVIDRTTINLLHCTPLRQRVESLNRRILLLCGAFLEVELQLSALTALKRGFEVHLLMDACAARSSLNQWSVLHALAVAGVHLSTLATLAGQLLVDVTDASALPVLDVLARSEASESLEGASAA